MSKTTNSTKTALVARIGYAYVVVPGRLAGDFVNLLAQSKVCDEGYVVGHDGKDGYSTLCLADKVSLEMKSEPQVISREAFREIEAQARAARDAEKAAAEETNEGRAA